LGISAAAEHISNIDAWLIAATFVYKPVASLATGPGVELLPRRPGGHGEHPATGHSLTTDEESTERTDSLFLWRFGVGYGFEFGERFSVTPGISLDLVREHGHWVEALVFGATLGVGF
jgi:hypothetical protein